MLQWTGGARRKMKAAKNAKLKTQREFFDNRKEKQRKMELGEEAGKVHTLADYIRQNIHGGESLDILGLRSLNPTPTDVNTAADFDASLPEPASAALKPNSGDGGDVTLTIPNVSAFSIGTPKMNSQDTSSQQLENKTTSGGIVKEKEQEKRPCAHSTPRVAAAVQQEIRKFLKRNMEISSPENRRNPVHVGNLQTKKVASTPQLKLLDIISDDNKDEDRGKRRLPSETYAFFSQDGNDAKEEKLTDYGVLHPQQKFLTSDSIGDWGDTKNFLNPSLELKNSYDCCSDALVTGTSGLLSRFLSTQKLKSFHGTSSSEPHEHDVTKDHLLNSVRVTHNGSHNLHFSDPAFNTTKANAKEPQKMNFPKSLFDMEYFHVKQEPQIFDISDPFANSVNYQAKQERQNYRYLNPGFNICGHQATLEYPFLPDQSFDWNPFKVDNNFFDQEEGSYIPENDSNTWDNDISSTLMKLQREFCTPDYIWSVQVPSYDRSQNNSRQFGSSDKFRDMIEDFYPNLESREISDEEFENSLSPMDSCEVERQYLEADFFSREKFSRSRMRTNRNKFENETLDWNDDERKKYGISEEWECDLSATWDDPWHQKNIDRAHPGGHSDQTQNPTGANSWSQTVDGGTADQFTDDLTSDRNIKQERVLPSETQAIFAPETLQDRKPFFLPQINNGDEDFIIVCFSDNKDCPAVDANNLHLPIRPLSIPLQVLGSEESSSVMDHDINVLSNETPFNRISQETDAFCGAGKGVTPAGATSATHNNLILAPENSTCDSILRSSHQSQLDYPLVPISTRSLGMGTEVTSWHVREPQREAYSELQSFPMTRRSFSSFLTKEKDTVEDSMKPNSSSKDRVDQCLSSNFLYANAPRHEMTHSVEENSVEMCTPFRKPLQDEMNGMSTSEVECMSRKRLWVEDGVAHDGGCRASFSSQEECSPARQLNPVQAVLCKLQRPAFSCDLKQGKLPEYGIRKVENVLLKLQRPTSDPIHGLGHQDAEANWTAQKGIKQTSDMDHKSNGDSEIKPTAECQDRLLTYHNTSGSRGSLPLLNASKPTRLSSKEGKEKGGLSEISTLRNKESKLSLDDIDAIASTDHRFSNQPYQRTSQSKAHSLPSVVRIKEVADSSVPRAGNANQYFFPISERNPVSEVTDRKQPSRRNSDPPISHTGGRESSSNTPQASEKQKIMEASEGQERLQNNQHNPPVSENRFLQSRSPTSTSHDADYVKMLESYVVQLKLENDILRLWTGS